MIHSYISRTNTDPHSIISTPWTKRAIANTFLASAASKGKPPLTSKKKYKPVHVKRRPVPTYMPNPEAQVFQEIPPPIPTELPIFPKPYQSLEFGQRVTLERLEAMLAKIEPGILTEQEIDLLSFVVLRREEAFAFEYAEKGAFSRDYYPDYEIPTIEHTPWQRPPIPIPKAIVEDVRKEIIANELAGKYEPTTSSYRSALFAVAKKPGSNPPVRLVVDLQDLNSVTIRDSALPPNLEEFAESFVGFSMYGLYDLFSGFD
ncbi:hypothetical protein IW262DRAFT_1276024, partial [Armillaria fumosa]